jgi:hypothetical protein
MKTQTKLSKLQRWILREALEHGQLEKVRIMAHTRILKPLSSRAYLDC